MRRSLALAFLGVIAAATCTVAPRTEPLGRGAALFARHCAICHGATGDADTNTADLLLPRPRAFRDGLFKLVSTENGIPTEDDLVRTLHFGMPGSTMMSWGWMPKGDLQLLAREVRRLAIAGRADTIRRSTRITGREMSPEEAIERAEAVMAPGQVVETGEMVAIDDGTVSRGREIYSSHCKSCHGDDGRGLPQTRQWPASASWLAPRDFTSGYLRADASHRELAYRIRAGMPGAHMPPTLLSAAETEVLVAYVRSMIPDGAGDRHAQWRRTVRVERVDQLPKAGALDTVRLPTVPLWWRADACDEVLLQAAHDGREILLTLSWADATRDDKVRPDARMSDGIAIQFARDNEPPLFAMGSSGQPVNVWRWHAFDPKQLAGITDLHWPTPHRGLDMPISIDLEPSAESVQLGGIGSVGRQAGSGLPLQVETTWSDGRWHATFRRALAARDAEEVDLTGEGPVLFALAVWNGAIDEHAGSKSITTWHVLQLQQ